MSDIFVQLGFNISNYNYDDSTELLYVSGPALEEGTWSDSLGGTFFYPSHIIKEAAPLFYNADLVCEHRNLPIGKITNVALNDKGFSLDGYFNNKDSITAVRNKDKLGFSIAANIKFNPITRVVEKIYNVKHVALVSKPACKICGITSAVTNEGNVIMATKKVKEEVEVSDTSPKVEEPVINEEVITEDTEVKVDIPITPVPPEVVSPSVNNISIRTDSITVEQPFGEVMAALSAATSTVENVSVQLASAITRLQEMETKCSNLEVQLSAKDSEIDSIKVEAASYKDKFETLQQQLNTQAQIERNNIISDIKTIDPDINVDIIDSMSTVQLSAYKASLDRFNVKGMIPGERKGFKADEISPADNVEAPVALSELETKELSKIQLCELVCAVLNETRNNSK